MSGPVSPPPPPPPGPPPGPSQSQASVLGPGIAGLFVQGIETGLIFSQFSQWFYTRDRNENLVVSTILMFVTAVGLYVPSSL